MEKRIQDRMSLYYYLKVLNAESGELLGHMVDFNTKGIRLISETPIPQGQEYQLSMALPETVFGRDQISFNAVCRHTTKSANPDLFESGFQIAILSEELYPLFRELIQRFAMGKN